MGTVTESPRPQTPTDDPYCLGWRYVRRRLADGSEVPGQVPLTPEDVLHPEEDDFLVQTDAHGDNREAEIRRLRSRT